MSRISEIREDLLKCPVADDHSGAFGSYGVSRKRLTNDGTSSSALRSIDERMTYYHQVLDWIGMFTPKQETSDGANLVLSMSQNLQRVQGSRQI
jgi:hypothetical protein